MGKATLVVMAAGIGSRYGGIKQLAQVGPKGEMILDYAVQDAMEAGFDKVVFVIRKDLEGIFREKIGRRVERWWRRSMCTRRSRMCPGGIRRRPGTGRNPGGPGRRCSAAGTWWQNPSW